MMWSDCFTPFLVPSIRFSIKSQIQNLFLQMMFLSWIPNSLTKWEGSRCGYKIIVYNITLLWLYFHNLPPWLFLTADTFTPSGWEEKSNRRCWQRSTVCYWCLYCSNYEKSESIGPSAVGDGMCWTAWSHVQGNWLPQFGLY